LDVLKKATIKGVCCQELPLPFHDPKIVAWLGESSLQARDNGSAPREDLLDSPSLFPFQLKPMPAESLLALSSMIDILRHGLDDDLVLL
jgi:hypothetical protein